MIAMVVIEKGKSDLGLQKYIVWIEAFDDNILRFGMQITKRLW